LVVVIAVVVFVRLYHHQPVSLSHGQLVTRYNHSCDEFTLLLLEL